MEASTPAVASRSAYGSSRMDADIRTLRKVLHEQHLGDIWRFDSRFDTADPAALEAISTLEVVDAARTSSVEDRVVQVGLQ